MHDLTLAETTWLEPGVERFVCSWPRCSWFVDWDFAMWSAQQQHIEVVWPPAPSDTPMVMAAVQAHCEAVMVAYHSAVENSLRAHLDGEHPGWTVEDLERHAAAYSILGLMGHG